MGQPDRAANQPKPRSAFGAVFETIKSDHKAAAEGVALQARETLLDLKKIGQVKEMIAEAEKTNALAEKSEAVAQSVDGIIKTKGFPIPSQELLLKPLPTQKPEGPTSETDTKTQEPFHPLVTPITQAIRTDLLDQASTQSEKARDHYKQAEDEEGDRASEAALSFSKKSREVNALATEIIALIEAEGYGDIAPDTLARTTAMIKEAQTPEVITQDPGTPEAPATPFISDEPELVVIMRAGEQAPIIEPLAIAAETPDPEAWSDERLREEILGMTGAPIQTGDAKLEIPSEDPVVTAARVQEGVRVEEPETAPAVAQTPAAIEDMTVSRAAATLSQLEASIDPNSPVTITPPTEAGLKAILDEAAAEDGIQMSPSEFRAASAQILGPERTAAFLGPEPEAPTVEIPEPARPGFSLRVVPRPDSSGASAPRQAPTPESRSAPTEAPAAPAAPEKNPNHLQLTILGNELRLGDKTVELTDDEVTIVLRLKERGQGLISRTDLADGVVREADEYGNIFRRRILEPLRAKLTELGGRDLIASVRSSYGGFALDKAVITQGRVAETNQTPLATELTANATGEASPAPSAEAQISPAAASEQSPTANPADAEATRPQLQQLILEGNILHVGTQQFEVTADEQAILSRLTDKSEGARTRATVQRELQGFGSDGIKLSRVITNLNRRFIMITGQPLIQSSDGSSYSYNQAEFIRREPKAPDARTESPAEAPAAVAAPTITPEAPAEAAEAAEETVIESTKLVIDGGVVVIGETRLPLHPVDKTILAKLAQGSTTHADLRLEANISGDFDGYMARLMGRVNGAAGNTVIARNGANWSLRDAEYVDPTPPPPAPETTPRPVVETIERPKTDITPQDELTIKALLSFVEGRDSRFTFSTVKAAMADVHQGELEAITDPRARDQQETNYALQTEAKIGQLATLIVKGREARASKNIKGQENLVALAKWVDEQTYNGKSVYARFGQGGLSRIMRRDYNFDQTRDYFQGTPEPRQGGSGKKKRR